MSNSSPRIKPRGYISRLKERHITGTIIKGYKMDNKDLSELTIIRLFTELENAIGHREHYCRKNDYKQYHLWDQEVEYILDDIRSLGENE